MSPCPHVTRVQEYLDGELSPEAVLAFRAHQAECPECSAELAAYARLFESLSTTPLWNPGPALTERVLDRVLPSRLRRRVVAILGWSYTGLSAVTTYLLVSWFSRPDTPAWLGGRLSEAYVRLAQAGLFVFHTLVLSGLRVLDGWSTLENLANRWGPVARMVATMLAHPTMLFVLLGAVLTSAGVLWWMRSGRVRVTEEVRHVGVLGF